ncbi:unnamed protein product [Rotaria sp. Silwood1]|nr:unnamed protein product [Rotaria sp. Silwood1]
MQQTLIQQMEDPQQHPLVKKINQWEQESIVKIRQAAEEARNRLIKTTTEYTNDLKQKLNNLSDELRQGQEDNDFIETDLQQWIQKLEELKKELHSPATVAVQEDSTPLISKILIRNQNTFDLFERVCGTAEIKENGCLVVKNNSSNHTEIRGQNEYNTGRHRVSFQIEQLASGGWIFFGIISKAEPMQTSSYSSPSSYGWSNQNQIFSGAAGQIISGETIEIVENDTITLLIDCNQKTVRLENDRLNKSIQQLVDINKCPFPWQLHLNLYLANTRVRILNSSN